MNDSIRLRRFKSEGIAKFRGYLVDLRHDVSLAPPFELLTDSAATDEIPHGPMVEARVFLTKRDAAEHLYILLSQLGLKDLSRDIGLWSWLGLRYFDSICPSVSGKRTPRAAAHYILDSDYKRIYRHLLRTPYIIREAIPQFNRLLLDQPIAVHGELIEQIISRLFIIRIPSVAEAMERMYFDDAQNRMKRGATSERRRGNLRARFPLRLRQLSLTYDVDGLSADQLVDLLGDEFRAWSSG